MQYDAPVWGPEDLSHARFCPSTQVAPCLDLTTAQQQSPRLSLPLSVDRATDSTLLWGILWWRGGRCQWLGSDVALERTGLSLVLSKVTNELSLQVSACPLVMLCPWYESLSCKAGCMQKPLQSHWGEGRTCRAGWRDERKGLRVGQNGNSASFASGALDSSWHHKQASISHTN